MSSPSDRRAADALTTIDTTDRRRRTVPLTAESSSGSDSLRLFHTNDYLGLSHHPDVREAAARAATRHGMGIRSASLIAGYSPAHADLEGALARHEGTDAALLFPSGYQANLGLMQTLGGPNTAFFSDELNHASLIDGMRLAKPQARHVYRHRDVDHLESLLAQSPARHKVIVTDAVFSMDGDLAPLASLAELRSTYGATLVVDEAHASLLFGDGTGLSTGLGLGSQVDFRVCTLSKAIGSHGGAILCSATAREWLVHAARTFVYTTALPVPVVAAARAALDVADSSPALRTRLWRHVARVGAHFGQTFQTPIIPIITGTESSALGASAALRARGFLVTAIRPPTVAPGTARLRITLSAAHTDQDVDDLLAALDALSLRSARCPG